MFKYRPCVCQSWWVDLHINPYCSGVSMINRFNKLCFHHGISHCPSCQGKKVVLACVTTYPIPQLRDIPRCQTHIILVKKESATLQLCTICSPLQDNGLVTTYQHHQIMLHPHYDMHAGCSAHTLQQAGLTIYQCLLESNN